MKKVLLALALATMPSVAAADFYDGNKLYEWCAGEPSLVLTYVVGVYDTEATFISVNKVPRTSCVPRNATAGQLVDVTCKYLKDYPNRRQYTASSTVLAAFIDAFPCR